MSDFGKEFEGTPPRPPQYPGSVPPGHGYEPPGQGYEPPARGPMAPPPAAPAPKKSRKLLIVAIALILGFFTLVGGCVAAVTLLSKGPIDAGNDFLALVDEQRFDEAYAGFAPSCRTGFTVAELEALFGGADVTDYRLSSTSVNSGNGPTTGASSGTIDLDGRSTPIALGLVKLEGDWRMCSVDLG